MKENYLKQLHNGIRQLNHPILNQQYQAIIESDCQIAQGKIPQHALPVLGVTSQIYIELLLKNQSEETIRLVDHLLRNYRQYLQVHYGLWAYLTMDFCRTLKTEFKGWRFLEIMAGNGYLSYGLRQLGVDVICTDNFAWQSQNQTGNQLLTKVEKMDAIHAIDQYQSQVDAILMSWAPNGVTIDYDVLSSLRKTQPQKPLLCLGERFGATNSQAFWQTAKYHHDNRLMRINQTHRPFDLMKDRLYWIV